MRAPIKEYEAVERAAMNFVKSVAEGNSKYAKELFTDEVSWNMVPSNSSTRMLIPFRAAIISRQESTLYLWRNLLQLFVSSKRDGATELTSQTFFFF